MKIKIRSRNARFTILLPNLLLFNKLTMSLVTSIINNQIDKRTENKGIRMNGRIAQQLMPELRRAKRKYGRLTLVDVVGSQGDIVQIIL